MLQKLNERIQGMIAWIIIGLVTVTFTLFGLDYYLQSRHSPDVKVKINGHVITKEEYELNYRRLSQTQGQDALTPDQEKELKQQVLSEMMVNAVSVAAARHHGFDVDSKQATEAILQIPQFQEDGHFSASRYTQALNNAFFTPQTFQQEVRQGMLLNQQRFALIGTEFVLPNELNKYVSLSMQTRDYQFTTIKSTDFINKERVTAEEEQAYYEAHKNQFMTKEQVSLEYVRLSLQAIKDKIKVSPEQIAHYYEENKSNYLMPAQWQLTYLRFPISEEQAKNTEAVEQVKKTATKWYDSVASKPEQFATLAKKAEKVQHAQIGDLPMVIAGQSALDQYLINLTQPGQMTAPIRTKHGYDVLQLKSYKPASIQSLTEVKNLIAEQLKQEMAQQQYAALEDQLSELSYQNPDSLAAIADTLHVPLQHTELLTQGQPSQEELTHFPAVMQAAFSNDVLTYGNNSEPIQADSDSLIVLRVKEHIPATLQNIAQVKPVIDAVLLKEKAALTAQKYGKNLIESAAKKLPQNLHWQRIQDASRDSELTDAQINELAFAMNDVGQFAGQELQNGDFAVVNLLKIKDGQVASEDKEQIRNLTQQLESNYGLMDYDLYISRLMSQAKIVK